MRWQNEDNADTIATTATTMTVNSHMHGYNDDDNFEIDEDAGQQRTRQCWYDEWCYDKDTGEDNADTMVLCQLQWQAHRRWMIQCWHNGAMTETKAMDAAMLQWQGQHWDWWGCKAAATKERWWMVLWMLQRWHDGASTKTRAMWMLQLQRHRSEVVQKM